MSVSVYRLHSETVTERETESIGSPINHRHKRERET